MRRDLGAFGRLRQALFHVIWVHLGDSDKLCFTYRPETLYDRPPPYLTVLDARSTISAAAVGETHPFSNGYKTYMSVLV